MACDNLFGNGQLSHPSLGAHRRHRLFWHDAAGHGDWPEDRRGLGTPRGTLRRHSPDFHWPDHPVADAAGALRLRSLLSQGQHGHQQQPRKAHRVPVPGCRVHGNLTVLNALEPAQDAQAEDECQGADKQVWPVISWPIEQPQRRAGERAGRARAQDEKLRPGRGPLWPALGSHRAVPEPRRRRQF